MDWDAFCRERPANCDAAGDPHYAPDDARMIAATLPVSVDDAGITVACSGARVVAFDRNCPNQIGVYAATASDPLVTIHVVDGGNGGFGPAGDSGNLNGSAIRIPAGAVAQLPGDGHLSVRQPSGVICQLYQVQKGNDPPKPVTERDLNVGDGGCASADRSREGTYEDFAGHAGVASQLEITGGLVRAEDLAGDRGDGTDSASPDAFDHAVYGSFTNNRAGVVWPAIFGDGGCTAETSGSAVMPLEGMYLYLDRAGFEIVRAWKPPVYLRPLRRFLGTLHVHGMLDLDSSGCSRKNRYANTLTWGPQAAYQAHGASPIDAYLAHVIAPNDGAFAPHGAEGAVYVAEPGAAYSFGLLYFEDVPGLRAANFHWLAAGCGRLAALGSTGVSAC